MFIHPVHFQRLVESTPKCGLVACGGQTSYCSLGFPLSCMPYSMKYEPGGKLHKERLNYPSIILFCPSFPWVRGKKKNMTDSLFSMLGFAPTSNSQVCHCWLSFCPGSDFLFWVVIVIGGVLESEKSLCRPCSGSWTFSDRLAVMTVRHLTNSQSVAELSVFSLYSALFSELYHFYPCLKAYWKISTAFIKCNTKA